MISLRYTFSLDAEICKAEWNSSAFNLQVYRDLHYPSTIHGTYLPRKLLRLTIKDLYLPRIFLFADARMAAYNLSRSMNCKSVLADVLRISIIRGKSFHFALLVSVSDTRFSTSAIGGTFSFSLSCSD